LSTGLIVVLPSAGGAFKNYKLGAGVDSGLELFAFGIQLLHSTLARMVRYWREEDLDSFTSQGLQMLFISKSKICMVFLRLEL
jgi:hypothetical protein